MSREQFEFEICGETITVTKQTEFNGHNENDRHLLFDRIIDKCQSNSLTAINKSMRLFESPHFKPLENEADNDTFKECLKSIDSINSIVSLLRELQKLDGFKLTR